MPQFVPLPPPATGRPPSGFRAMEPSRHSRNPQRVSASATLRPAPQRSASALPPPPSLARSPQPGPVAQSSPPATLRPSPLRPSPLRPSTLGPSIRRAGIPGPSYHLLPPACSPGPLRNWRRLRRASLQSFVRRCLLPPSLPRPVQSRSQPTRTSARRSGPRARAPPQAGRHSTRPRPPQPPFPDPGFRHLPQRLRSPVPGARPEFRLHSFLRPFLRRLTPGPQPLPPRPQRPAPDFQLLPSIPPQQQDLPLQSLPPPTHPTEPQPGPSFPPAAQYSQPPGSVHRASRPTHSVRPTHPDRKST